MSIRKQCVHSWLQMEKKTEWFADWFDSPYYHILYGHRDYNEAEFFLRNLINFYQPQAHAKIIDLACGKGRHSIFLNSLGFDVTGVDLSSQSILAAKHFENETLSFEVGDLRYLSLTQKFQYALNLFTSFGYFEDFETDIQVLKNVHSILLDKGIFLIDFFNAHKVIKDLVRSETIERQGILFNINRDVINGKIVKTIAFEHDGKSHHYLESVQALSFENFEELFAKSGFKMLNYFGNYKLEPFHLEHSDRLILIGQKI